MNKLTVEMTLTKALPEDLKEWSTDQAKDILKYGQLIFVKSQITNLLNGPFILGHNTDPEALAEWLAADMLYIPVDNFESQIPILKTLSHAS